MIDGQNTRDQITCDKRSSVHSTPFFVEVQRPSHFNGEIIFVSDCYDLASQPGEHMVNKHVTFNESRMFDVTHYITSSFQEKGYMRN